jgi:hypothetical protein
MAVPQERLRVAERPGAAAVLGLGVSWGGVWGGLLIAIGTMLLLATLGVAIGASAVDPSGGTDVRNVGIGAAIWAGLTLLVAMFVGGMIAARLGVIVDRPTSALHGALVWVLAMLAVLYLATSGVSLGVNALLGVAGGAARAAGTSGVIGDLTSGDVSQILARLDDPSTARTVAAATGMSEDEARRSLSDVRQRVEAARNDPQRAVAEARDGLRQMTARVADRAAGAARTTSWATFGAMVVSLAAAIGGAMVGARRTAERVAARL